MAGATVNSFDLAKPEGPCCGLVMQADQSGCLHREQLTAATLPPPDLEGSDDVAAKIPALVVLGLWDVID